MRERTVILYTFSKKFAMTGWRLGGAIGPEEVIAPIATLNVNQESCTTHFIQWAGVEALTGDQSGAQDIVRILEERRDVAVGLLNETPGVTCYRPEATFYLFPDVTELMERKGFETYDQLRRAALEQTGCSFCTRLHFGRELPGEERRYVRIAYSGISSALIREGLGRLREWAM
jgi:aspartate/methionine/tyrosine aminotransferase